MAQGGPFPGSKRGVSRTKNVNLRGKGASVKKNEKNQYRKRDSISRRDRTKKKKRGGGPRRKNNTYKREKKRVRTGKGFKKGWCTTFQGANNICQKPTRRKDREDEFFFLFFFGRKSGGLIAFHSKGVRGKKKPNASKQSPGEGGALSERMMRTGPARGGFEIVKNLDRLGLPKGGEKTEQRGIGENCQKKSDDPDL